MDDDDAPAGAPEWMVTFGDMMSLLLTFFIMLVSMSEVNQDEKYQALVESMRRQFGHDLTMAALVPGETPPMNPTVQSTATMARAKRDNILRGASPVKASTGEDQLVTTMRHGHDKTPGGVVYFGEDSAELDEAARATLALVAEEIVGKPQKIEVRGHASPKPAPEGDDHWSLATKRSRAVMDYLVQSGVEPERLRFGSAGAYEPIDARLDDAFRRRNARVEVLMWDEPVSRLLPNP
jgi:chemotaxis protein MotB